jgi:hypothetical protein
MHDAARRSLASDSRRTSPRFSSRSMAAVEEPLVKKTLSPIVLTGIGPLLRRSSRISKSDVHSPDRAMSAPEIADKALWAFISTSQT